MAAEIMDWTQVCVWAAVLAAVIYTVVKFIRMPTEEQIRVIKECLLNWRTDSTVSTEAVELGFESAVATEGDFFLLGK